MQTVMLNCIYVEDKGAADYTESSRSSRPRTRRTTLTLPDDLLRRVERLSVQRHQTMSAAIAHTD